MAQQSIQDVVKSKYGEPRARRRIPAASPGGALSSAGVQQRDSLLRSDYVESLWTKRRRLWLPDAALRGVARVRQSHGAGATARGRDRAGPGIGRRD